MVSWLERNGYDEAAGSLREGMEETLTVVKLALPSHFANLWPRRTPSNLGTHPLLLNPISTLQIFPHSFRSLGATLQI